MRHNRHRSARSPVRRLGLVTTAAVVAGGTLMVAGSVYAVMLQPTGPEDLNTVWPFYLGGIVAVVLGWLNGDLRLR